jgi:DNA-binding XRE family transcriptional regulator
MKNMSQRMTYRNRVRECRLRALVGSQTELARLTGIDRTTISHLENQRLFLSIRNALVIKEALGCSLDELYEKVAPGEESNGRAER